MRTDFLLSAQQSMRRIKNFAQNMMTPFKKMKRVFQNFCKMFRSYARQSSSALRLFLPNMRKIFPPCRRNTKKKRLLLVKNTRRFSVNLKKTLPAALKRQRRGLPRRTKRICAPTGRRLKKMRGVLKTCSSVLPTSTKNSSSS